MENWVKLRHDCSPLEVFLALKEGANEDSNTRNELKGKDDPVRFRVAARNKHAFEVYRESGDDYTLVRVSWDRSGITVHDRQDKVIDKATLTLTDEGECKLKLASNGDELTGWQFRKRFLESLFFDF
jgi:hypothetical protein